MKFYPPKYVENGLRDGFTYNQVVSGAMFVYADVQCQDCKHTLPLAVAGSTDNGKCNRCGGKTA